MITLEDPEGFARMVEKYERTHPSGLRPLDDLKCVRMAPKFAEAIRKFCKAPAHKQGTDELYDLLQEWDLP